MVGWGQPVRSNGWAPDGRWYGDVPRVLVDMRGAAGRGADPEGARRRSRTTATAITATTGCGRARTATPSSRPCCARCRSSQITLPPNAVGKDFRDGSYAGLTDSGTGVEASLCGLLGVKIGWVEGIELNLLGLVAGLDLRHPAVKLPGFGRLGIDDGTAVAAPRATQRMPNRPLIAALDCAVVACCSFCGYLK